MAGVPEPQYNEVVKADELLSTEILKERLDFLTEVRSGCYAEVKKVWSLLTPETWKMYKLLGKKQLAEQNALRKACRVLRKRWQEHYGE